MNKPFSFKRNHSNITQVRKLICSVSMSSQKSLKLLVHNFWYLWLKSQPTTILSISNLCKTAVYVKKLPKNIYMRFFCLKLVLFWFSTEKMVFCPRLKSDRFEMRNVKKIQIFSKVSMMTSLVSSPYSCNVRLQQLDFVLISSV